MKANEYYIYGRWFYIFNDHQNLLQIAASTVPIIVQMRLYMQSHVFFRNYVKGTDNWAAALGKLVTEKPVDFVVFDNVVEFNKNRQNTIYVGFDYVVKAYKSLFSWNSLKKKPPID